MTAGAKKKIQKIARPDYIATSGGTAFKVNRAYVGDKMEQRRFAECVVMCVDSKGRTQPLRCLLDTGCSKSIILKKFTESKRRIKQSKEDQIRYTTWGGSFDTHCKASVGFRLIEFEEKGKQTIEHEFQVDGTEYPKGKEPKYNMVIGN